MTRPFHRWYQGQAARLAYRRGFSYVRQTSHVKAIAAFTDAIEKGYFYIDKALLARGLSYVQLKDVARAIADFDTVINDEKDSCCQLLQSNAQFDANPNFTLAQAHHQRGLLRQKSGNEAGALADWSAAIAHWPHYPEPHYQRALAHLGQGHHSKALADLDAALTGNPTMAQAYMQRGNLRHQLGNIPEAIADWELAACNDYTLKSAQQKLASIHQATYDAKLSAVLEKPLAAKGLSAEVTHHGTQLDIYIHRPLGTGVNYYTLPDLIRKHLVPLHLANVEKFQLIGHLADVSRPDWQQSYDLYKNQPCPPSNWQAAFSTLVVFPPFGIPAFIQAAQVKRLYNRGQYVEALSASKAVKGLCVAGSVTLGFCTLLPLGYAAYDSMKEEPTFRVATKQAGSQPNQQTTEQQTTEQPYRPYHEIRQD